MSRFPENWVNILTVGSVSFVCGYCGSSVSSDKGFTSKALGSSVQKAHIYICHVCNKPTFIYQGKTTPAAALGNSVNKLPPEINAIYDEIRFATSVNAFSAAVLTARKLLMHIAVEKGAPENKNFVFYVDYLESNHYTPPNSRNWVDKIRQLGNEANHEIVIMDKDHAVLILNFIEFLLKFMYEFPDNPPETE
jgi:hypothetical protein